MTQDRCRGLPLQLVDMSHPPCSRLRTAKVPSKGQGNTPECLFIDRSCIKSYVQGEKWRKIRHQTILGSVPHHGLKVNRAIKCRNTRRFALNQDTMFTWTANNTECDEQALQNLMGWLTANGCTGLEDSSSCISIFKTDDGERGIIATKDISKGSILFQVPMKVAVVDDDEELQKWGSENPAPWSVRLACKILQLKAEGGGSAWKDYVNTLPNLVPSPLSSSFGWDDIRAIGYPIAREQLDFTNWMIMSHWKALPNDAVPPGTTFEDFLHAICVCHSRTFSVPARTKDGIVRFLMPLVDMLNHAGDVDLDSGLAGQESSERSIACDAVRWDCVSKIGGQQMMIISAVRDIAAGEEVTLSYGERSNDDFFLYYGFIPPRNPHDNVILHENIEDALEWNLQSLRNDNISEELLLRGQNAVTEIMAKFGSNDMTEEENAITAMDSIDSKRILEEKQRISMSSGGRVDERLLVLLETLLGALEPEIKQQDKYEFVKQRIALRSSEILRDMYISSGASLVKDLELLSSREAGAEGDHIDSDDVTAHNFNEILNSYAPMIENSAWSKEVYSCVGNRDDAELIDAGVKPNLLDIPPTSPSRVDLSKDSKECSDASLLPIIYRTYKSMILWDALIIAPKHAGL